MKSSCIFLICVLFILTAFRPVEAGLEIGAPIPKSEVKLHDISGREITLNAARGSNGLLVMFSGNRCPYVVRNQGRTTNICAYALKHQVGVILINSNIALQGGEESLENMQAYAAQQQYTWFYVVDKKAEIADAFDAGHTPECFLFDKNGRLSYKGAIDDNPGNAEAVKVQHLLNALNDMLAGKPVKVSTSSTMGCNIKRF
ncbi:redoxin domain-containing protein [Chitinophaga agrisoli]|uniref:Redoxin domain-containing protein n=1 Tax=Chitinophaga agrisoli TaxID=2607653 RepID=A0A5B2VZI7_9BACT|nr:redoxin domain-containing protein [Chitinophaga agrisoli]KAA2243449.1 redoxin domain-containing protein [Chitinophaga agrisoli]